MDSTDLKYLLRHAVELILPSRKQTTETDEWFYFLHIPKTAGTSFRYALYDRFKADEVYPNNIDYYLRQQARFLSFREFEGKKDVLFPRSRKLLIGHFGLTPVDEHFRTPLPRTISFLRDPVARLISTINYQSRPGRKFHGMGIEEILSGFAQNEGQLQARFFGYNPKKKNLQEVFENMEKIDVLGIMEQYDKSVRLINQVFNWDLKNVYRKNRSLSDSKLNPAAMHADRLASYCEVEQQVYDFGLKLFESQCNKYHL